ncbi:hypothetical protein KAT36_02630 [Candidatus Pacearchaeota archaeon]|nr:hypothetical protein [Candidatus Pacearchaeota archaeon]
MNSIPIEVVRLGFDFDDYVGIARNVQRVLNMQQNWDSILERANSELPEWASDIGTMLPMTMGYDREFFREAGLDYAEGIPVQGCFTVAVADYMLRNRGRLELTSTD